MKNIFISSTFRDMNEERDLFHKQICPELNEIAREYGESISFCDLRWGVDTTTLESEDGSRKVLSVCLDEIDRCRPYMVVLLGERYGWIPSADLISETISHRRDFALEELDKSVTALEIEYGALRNSDQLGRTLFYFRQLEGTPTAAYSSESEVHAEKLNTLKQRIMDTTGGRIKTYSVRWDDENNCICGLDAFADMVVSDIRALMEHEWQELAALTPYQKDLHSQWEMAAQKGAQFTARYDLIGRYAALIREGPSCFAIRGPSGCGKSTIISRLALDFKEEGSLVLPVFCGSSSLCTTAMEVLRYIVEFIESALGLPHLGLPDGAGRNEWRSRLDELVSMYSEGANKPLVIMIDAVDQLLADDERDALQFLPTCLSDHVKVVLSCLDDFRITRDIQIEDIPNLNREDRQTIVRGILAPTGRSLSDEVIHAIASKDDGDKPLYLSLLVSRLEMMDRDDFEEINRHGGGIDAINRKQIELIQSCPVELEALCVELLSIAAEKLGSVLPFIAANYLAMSRYGLRESDLEGIFRLLDIPWDSLSFSRFRLYMNRFFIQRDDGRLDFAHKTFRRGFVSAAEDEQALHKTILRHFRALHEKDDIRLREIVHHCIMADDKQYFVEYITSRCGEEDFTAECARENTASHALKDGGSWLCALLQDSGITGKTHDLYAFLILGVLEHMPESLRTVAMMDRVYEAVIGNKEHLLKTSRGRVLLDLSYYKLSNVYIAMGGMEQFERAEALMKQAMEDMDTDWDMVDDEAEVLGDNSKVYLLSLYCHLANLYVTIGQQQKLEAALELLFEALDRAEKLRAKNDSVILQQRFAAIYGGIASVYSRFDRTQDRQKILLYNEKSCAILEKLMQDNYSIDRDALIARYDQMITVLSLEQDPDQMERAFELARKALALSEARVREEGSLDALSVYAGCQESLAGLYMKRGDNESLKKALGFMNKAVAAQEAVIRENDTESSAAELAAYLYITGNIYCELGGTENLRSAYDMYERGIKLMEHCAAVQDTPVVIQMVASGYIEAGVIQEALGEEENIALALELYQKAIGSGETAVNMLGSEISCYTLRRSLGLFARLKEKLGCPEEALAYFLKRAELDRSCIQAYDSSDWAEMLASALVHICVLCMDLEGPWLGTALECYYEQVRLNEQWSARGLSLCDADELRVIYNNIAWIYENFEGHTDPAKALEFRIKCCCQAKAVYAQEQSGRTLRVLTSACRKLGKTYKASGDMNSEQVLACLREAVSFCEAAVSDDSSQDNLLYLALCCSALGEISHDPAMLQRGLAILQDLYRQTGDENYRTHILRIEEALA